FQLSPSRGDGRSRARLLVLPTVPKIQESPATEEVLLVRDEVANMVWAIENTVPLPHGASKGGSESAYEMRQHIRRLRETSITDPPEPAAAWRYRVMNTVPEHWIPFVPVHVSGSNREIQLQRGAMPRFSAPGEPIEKVRPRTSLLRRGL